MNFEDKTLDPEDWESMRKLGYQMIDDSIEFLSKIREQPVWKPMPESEKAIFQEKAPSHPSDPSEVFQQFKDSVLEYRMGTPHPRFWAWYMGNSSMTGALADFWTSIMNSNGGGGNHSGLFLEHQVMNWMKEIMHYPKDSSGLLVSGGSMANYVGLAVARHEKAGYDIRSKGLVKGGLQFTIYASTEVHSCNVKAAELLGIGHEFLRLIEVNPDYTINLEALEKQIQEDIDSGLYPIALIGSAGTVNTGAIDDLQGLAAICKRYDLWFHVDGAIGAIAMLSDKVRPLLAGIELSDSVAIDLHKWLHIPFETGCTLVKNKKSHRDTFALIPEYLTQEKRGLAAQTDWMSEYGLQLSRRLRCIKVWWTIKEHGLEKLGQLITKNVDHAEYLADRIRSEKELELLEPIGMDIVCYRFKPDSISNTADLNVLNKQILVDLQEQGHAAPSYTTLKGIYYIRPAIANYRSTFADFDFLVDKTLDIGRKLIIQNGR